LKTHFNTDYTTLFYSLGDTKMKTLLPKQLLLLIHKAALAAPKCKLHLVVNSKQQRPLAAAKGD
jgi:hypothetical protein